MIFGLCPIAPKALKWAIWLSIGGDTVKAPTTTGTRRGCLWSHVPLHEGRLCMVGPGLGE